MKRLKNISANADMSDNQVKFFYKGEYLGSCDPEYMKCDKLYELIKSDSRAATQVLNYMNSLGDPVFPTKEGGYEPETDVSKVDPLELYNTFMQELDYSYRDFPKDFYVGGDYIIPDFEIFIDSSDEVVTSTKIKASRYDNVPGYKAPNGGYLYIFKHGIGPGTMPKDVEIIKTKDLPNYYTAVWLSDFLTTDELKKYDIPDETRINSILDSIGYCQKNGDVVPYGDVEACTSVKANSYTSSRKRCTNVTKEVLDYTKRKYPALYKELSDKDIWITIWGDGEYSLSYNSIKDPNTFLSDSVKQDFMNTMEELYPGSFWGDIVDIDACNKVTASRRVSANKKYVKAFVTQDREDAWALIDQYMEREWGHVEYNESARAILVMEMPFDGISEDGNSYSEGTCSAIINLMDFELRFNVYIPEAEGIAEEDWDHTIKYDSLADMVTKLIQPMADGEITEEKLYEMCESYYY